MLYLIVILLIIYYVYSKLTSSVSYWQSKGIFFIRNPIRRFVEAFFGTRSVFDVVKDSYNEHPEKRYYGGYNFFRPALVVRDLDLIKQITVKDFEYFPDHVAFSNKSDPIVDENLFSLEGEKWKDMRSTLSPAFTSSKMKSMYTLMRAAAENFAEHFYEQTDKNVVELEMKKAYAKYTNDVIATCAFGVECNSLKNEKNDFFVRGSMFAEPKLSALIKTLLIGLFPKIFQIFRIPVFSSFFTGFFLNLVKETIALRERNGIVRPDMIHLLMEARKGRLRHETNEKAEEAGFATVEESAIGKSSRQLELTDEVITGQAIVFFIAGFDTSSSLLSFLTYHLAIDQTIQDKLHTEIDNTLKGRSSNTLSYEELLAMKYLDQVVSETLRRYPAGFILTRMCRKDYVIKAKYEDEVDFTLDNGILVTIPVCGIHMDPKYFPDPEKFDPERFSDENKGRIVPGSYMPFGSGPRNCIGSRFALLECKVLIVSLLSRFDIVPVEKTSIPLKLGKSFNLSAKHGVWLGLKRRENN